jgi:PhnB protein
MAQVNPYLIFKRDCEAAFLFYKSVFGGAFPYKGKFGDVPSEIDYELSEEDKNKVMHASLPIGDGTLLIGSDSNFKSGQVHFGNSVSISKNIFSREEAEKLFCCPLKARIIKMPLTDTLWGAYFRIFTYKFGIHWMVNFYEQPKLC